MPAKIINITEAPKFLLKTQVDERKIVIDRVATVIAELNKGEVDNFAAVWIKDGTIFFAIHRDKTNPEDLLLLRALAHAQITLIEEL